MSPIFAGVVELVDTGDLKSPGSDTVPVRVRSPAPHGEKRTTKHRGVEQLVARRAHNPEVGGSSPPSATRCAENIDAKKSRNLCGFGIFLSAFSATGSKRNYAPIFSMGENLNEYMTVLKAAFVTFLHKSWPFFLLTAKCISWEAAHKIMIQKSTILCYNMMK